MTLQISILIVNYNGAKHLRDCLRALEVQSLPRYQFEVIVWDNASPDGSGEIVASEFPWCKLVRSQSNVGFAQGNNLAKSFARGEWLVLLNNDTIPDPLWLEELLIEARESGANRVVSKLVLGPKGTVINSGGVVLLRSGWAADEGFRMIDDCRFEQSRDVFGGCGAALMIRNRQGDVFPSDYFAYYEDVDAAWGEQANGQSTRYASRAVVQHALGSSAGERSPLFTFLTERNRVLTTIKNADPFLAGVAVIKFALKSVMEFGRKRTPHSRSRLSALISFVFRFPLTVVRRYDTRSPQSGGWR